MTAGAALRTLVVSAALASALSGCTSTVAPLSDTELQHIMDLREQQLGDLAAGYGLDSVPDIPALVRWITLEESPATMVECMNAAGFPAKDIGGGGVSYEEVPPEQAGLGGPLYLAMWTCNAEYSVDPRTQVLLTDAQFRILYDYNDTTLRSCLAAHDIEISEAPSFKKFTEDYYQGSPWVPWSEVSLADVGQKEWAELEKECPQAPPSTELYGAPLPQP